ncbi:MAG: dihydroneopterin aldolase [Lautropia sp.]|nr:dihydroneopterin aldolase [Lautropia sp.]
MPDASPSIFLQGLTVQSLIGVYPEERLRTQTLTLDVQVGLPSRRAFTSDEFADTIDYAAVAEAIRHEALQQSFSLLERLAHHLCDMLCRQFRAPWVQIRIVKPNIVPGAMAVGVNYRLQATEEAD